MKIPSQISLVSFFIVYIQFYYGALQFYVVISFYHPKLTEVK
jgi:hypothetical protein